MAESPPTGTSPDRRKRILKWVVLIAALFFFFLVIREAVDPFGDEPYLEISHGDHVHYVPRDRDEKVSISRFPTQRPGPDEMITPEGRVVPKQEPPDKTPAPEAE